MKVTFWKMNGAGNDFVVIDNRAGALDLDREQIARLCHRQRGVGADGLLAVEPAVEGGDYRMRYYNADGGEAEMCGNGARCFARFVDRLAERRGESLRFETPAGLIEAAFPGGQVRIALGKPLDLQMNRSLHLDGHHLAVHTVNTGVPHAVIPDEHVERCDIRSLGRAIRFYEIFQPAGTNVNAMEVVEPGRIRIRTYERGVEDETLACGTGMAACAIVYHELTGHPSPVRVEVRGGDVLEVEFSRGQDGFEEVFLTGPADFVFEGSIEI